MRPLDEIRIVPGSLDVDAAAAELAGAWELAEDVAQAALMRWLELAAVAMLGDAPAASSAKLDTSHLWRQALEETQRQKAQHLGPWLPHVEVTAPIGSSVRTWCVLCSAPLRGTHPTLCSMCEGGLPPC